MTDRPNPAWLADQFEAHRPHLRALAYRMLGSSAEADDAVQDAWLRVSRSDTTDVVNLRGWLTTVVARLCLDALRARRASPEKAVGVHLPDPVVSLVEWAGPEEDLLVTDSVGLAMLVVLDRLSPPERLAFVLHDVFGLPFDEIAPIVERSVTATRQLASRARRRVRGADMAAASDLARQREVVGAFLAASRAGDFDALLAVLAPDVAVRADTGTLFPGVGREVRGARRVAELALRFRSLAGGARHAVVDGAPGFVVHAGGRPFAVLGFVVRSGRIVSIEIVADPDRLRRVVPTA